MRVSFLRDASLRDVFLRVASLHSAFLRVGSLSYAFSGVASLRYASLRDAFTGTVFPRLSRHTVFLNSTRLLILWKCENLKRVFFQSRIVHSI